MRKRKGTARILAFIICLLMIFCSIDLSTLEVQAANDTTIIDVTGLATGTETSHDCNRYLTSKYNESQHWQECAVCGKLIGSKTNHSFTDNGWTYGSANYCNNDNVHRFSCSCGYSITNSTGRREHNYSSYLNETSLCRGYVYTSCSNGCGDNNAYKLALSNKSNWNYGSHRHIRQDGVLINSTHLGKCVYCNKQFTQADYGSMAHYHSEKIIYNSVENVYYDYCYCGFLRAKLRTGNVTVLPDGRIHVYMDIYLPEGDEVTYAVGCFYANRNSYVTHDTHFSKLSDGWTRVSDYITYTSHIESKMFIFFLINTTKYNYCMDPPYTIYISPDSVAPTINSITQRDISIKDGWSTGKKISISGTENYCNSIRLTMKDSEGTVYLNNIEVSVNNKNWSYSFIPDIEADANGKTFTVTATDTLGNSSSKTFTVYKTDKKAPIPTSINTTETKWSKSKSFTASATDKGSGKVQIAFNNTSGYALATANGTSFSRNYTFTGDVYGNVTAAVYFKDAVGNERTNFIKIYNIDNTAPTITDVTGSAVEDEKVEFVVSANDNKDFGGTVGIKSGSGVSKYAISSNNTAPASGWQTSNKLYATSSGTYYIFAKDAVGNISEPYQVEVIKLTLNFNGGKFNSSSTSKVMLGAICGSKTSHTFGIKTYYGTLTGTDYNSKGLNTKLTKTDKGIQYRFLGYSLKQDVTVPDVNKDVNPAVNFDVYSSSRIENYTIRDNTTLYAVWEPVLQMTVQLSAPSHPGTIELTDDLPVNTTLGNFKILSGTKNTDLLSSGTASVNPATIGTNVTNKDSVTYTVTAKGASSIKFSTAADSRILDIYNHGKNNSWFDKLNTTDKFEYTIDNFSNTTRSFKIPQYLGTTQSYQTSNPALTTGTTVYAIKFTCTQPSYYYDKYWHSDESTSVYCILFLKATDSSTGGTGGNTGGSTGGIDLPPYAVEDGMYDFQTILN